MVKRWHFRRIDKKGNVMKGKPPSQVGWMVSIKSIQAIWTTLKSKGFQYLRQRSINQDPLENLFGAVRSSCGSNDNPTCIHFASSLKTQILNGLTQQDLSGTNCEQDDSILLSDLRSFISMEVVKEPGIETLSQLDETTQAVTGTTSKQDAHDIAEAVAIGSVETLSVAYVSGYIAGRLLKAVNCASCHENLTSEPELPHNKFITFKEYSEDKRKLVYPSENLVVLVGHGITKLEDVLNSMAASDEIGAQSSKHLHNLDFSFVTCPAHFSLVKNHIVNGIYRIGIPWWCKPNLVLTLMNEVEI
ncbi:hypothetical protein NQ317_011575 [Molorchus minor]|uniref:Transposable element P transposase-like RNase H C-terminal domain-containing protein n=1 Tax=Molorchus minor TaxID=1323400 RepID=A0ABQ9IUJ6_9CUCU|nr:hypothetical protein NQ317_011575 [Molorchus minor]